MSYTLYKAQEDALERLYKMKSAVIALMPGLGKCKSLDSRIQTNKGYIPIGSLLPSPQSGFTDISDKGFLVSTRYGEKKVTKFYYEEQCILRYFTLENGLVINGTLMHRVLARDDNYNATWKYLGELTTSDYIMLSIGKFHTQTSSIVNDVSNEDLYSLGSNNTFPDYIHKCSREQKINFILGLTAYYKGNLLKVSEYNRLNIQYILESLGILYFIQEDDSLLIDSETLYKWNSDNINEYYPLRIVGIEDVVSNVCDIEVEDVHEYLSQGVINHNTLLTLHLAKYLQENESTSTLFCIPKSARAAYTKELKYKLEEPFLMINSDEPLNDREDLYKYKFVLVEFPVLDKYIDDLVQYVKDNKSYIFIDEAHALCSPKSAQTSYMRMIREHCVGCYSITASPLMTSIEGLYYLYNFTFPTLKVFQSWFRFRSLYCITKDRTIRMMGKKRIIKEIVGYKNIEELNTLLDKITIKGSIPYDVDYHFLKVELDPVKIPQYSLAAKGLLVTEKEKEWGPRLHDLQRVVDGLPQNTEVKTECNKSNLLIRCIKEIMERNEATLVYIEYMDTIEYIKWVLNNHKDELNYNNIYVISGKEKEEKRQHIEQNLQPRDIVLMSKAGRQSRNLQRANNLIFYNIPYSLGDLLQTSGRICRVDTTYNKQHFYLLEVDKSIDSYRMVLFKDHLALLDRLLGKSCRGTLTCDYVEIDKMNMDAIKRSLLWRMK